MSLTPFFSSLLDGIPIRDFVGGSGGFRRPGYTLYLNPGIVVSAGRNTWSINVPVRVHQNFEKPCGCGAGFRGVAATWPNTCCWSNIPCASDACAPQRESALLTTFGSMA
jgi:hypothetical protein